MYFCKGDTPQKKIGTAKTKDKHFSLPFPVSKLLSLL